LCNVKVSLCSQNMQPMLFDDNLLDIQIEILISGHQKHIMLSISKAQAFDLLCKLFFYTLIENIII